MKKIIVGLMLISSPVFAQTLATVSGTAAESTAPVITVAQIQAALAKAPPLSLSLGGNYHIALSTSATSFYTEVDRNFYPDGQWGIGWGWEALPIYKGNPASGTQYELCYIGFSNTFVVGDKQGLFGVNLGIKTPTLIMKGIQELEGKGDIIAALPPLERTLLLATSFDVGYSNRAFGVPAGLAAQGVRKANWVAGFHINLAYLPSLFGVAGSLASE